MYNFSAYMYVHPTPRIFHAWTLFSHKFFPNYRTGHIPKMSEESSDEELHRSQDVHQRHPDQRNGPQS